MNIAERQSVASGNFKRRERGATAPCAIKQTGRNLAFIHQAARKQGIFVPIHCIQPLKMRNKETNRDLAEFFGNKRDGCR